MILPFFISADFSALLGADVIDGHEVAAVDKLFLVLHHEPEDPAATGLTWSRVPSNVIWSYGANRINKIKYNSSHELLF